MPELPEVETVARVLAPQLRGCVIDGVGVRRPEVIAHPDAPGFCTGLTGRTIADLTRLPAALFVVDVQKESNAVKEAKRLSIPVFAMVDTCCDPTDIDYVIPANDDATKSIAVVLEAMCAAIAEGTEERKLEKEKEAQEAEAGADAPVKKEGKPRIKKAVKAAIDAEEAAVADVVAAVETPFEEPAEVAAEEAAVVAEEAAAVAAEEVAEAKAE